MHPVRSTVGLGMGERIFFFFFCSICLSVCAGTGMPGSDYNPHPRFICTPIPADADPGCFPTTGGPGGPSPGHHSGPSGNSNSWWGMSEEAKATILHLRESLVQQKETILDQRETIRELTAKLNLCEGFNRGTGSHDDHPHRKPTHLAHHAHHAYPTAPDTAHLGWAPPDGNHGSRGMELGHYGDGGHHRGKASLSEKHVTGEIPSPSSTPEQMSRMLQSLKERLESLQTRNTSTSYSSSLKDLLQRKINALEQQMQHHSSSLISASHSDHEGDDDGGHHDDDHDNGPHEDSHDDHHDPHDESHHSDHHDDDHHDNGHHDDDGHHDNSHHDNEVSEHGFERLSYNLQGHREAQVGAHSKLDAVLSDLQHRLTDTGFRKNSKSTEGFQVGFPMRTNYMYGRVKRTLLHEIFSFTLCLWMKAGIGPGLGTPFSYSVPGQANELVLIEWGNNPMELLVDDRAVPLPLSLSDGKWHHVCVTWSTRDGLWEAYQDGVKRGSGENLSPWHPIKPGGVFILGQEQDTLGGRFDATQAYVGEISDVQMWSHVLTPHDVYSLASCGGHMTGDIIAWSESVVELHGGATKYPFDPCH
ncbi:neuronal pentraxin-2 [Pimephales promelas]|uniref:neuronal pentraxin-2 n=1 Tax=Pimephales promelas TaxID=90988 RepID=UPI001955CA61|nr:neuronal pentraxin-2 [Pimephales promelas]KAG1936133.1 neuronal pentraxin-1 [Pimephales promelas]